MHSFESFSWDNLYIVTDKIQKKNPLKVKAYVLQQTFEKINLILFRFLD